MNRWLSSSLCVVLAFVLAAALPGCGSGDSGPTIKIAVCCPISGSSAAHGQMIKNAARLKEKQVNDAGGIEIDGVAYRLKCVIYDDKGDTTEATNVARKVTADDDILLVVGHFNSTCSLAAKDEYNRVGIVEFSPGSTNVNVCKGGDYTFRNLYHDRYQGHQAAQYIKKVVGANSVAVVYDNDDYGAGLKNHFVEAAGEIDLEVTAEIDYLRERTQDFKPLAQQAKDSGAEALFFAGLYNEAALVTKAARDDLGMTIPIIGSDGVMSPTYIKNAGDAAEGAIVCTPFLVHEGTARGPVQELIEAYQAMHGEEPDTWAALTYDALGMSLEAIRVAGLDRKAIRDQLATARDEESGYEGVTGVTYFDEHGDCYSKPVFVATVKDGAFVPAPQQMPE